MANANESDTDTNTASESPSSSTYCILAFYKFVQTTPLPSSNEISVLRSEIESVFREHHARGNVLLAPEGINGTVCYPLQDLLLDDTNNGVHGNSEECHNAVLEFLTTKFEGIRTRISWSSSAVFTRLKIRIKSEIVTMGKVLLPAGNNSNDDDVIDSSSVKADRPCSSSTAASSSCLRQSPGEYVPPDQWNALVQDPNVLVVDTRNEYEIAVGTFRNAVNPHTESFLEFPDWLDQYLVEQQTKQERPITGIAMFCTGGVRCEKATAYCRQVLAAKSRVMLATSISIPASSPRQDQQQSEIDDQLDMHSNPTPAATAPIPVYHLEGGILAYLDMIPSEESLFEGDCFVFDQRIAVQTGLQPAPNYTSCHACRAILRPVDLQSDKYEAGITCPACWDTRAERQERYRERQWQMMLSQQKGIPHLHDAKEFTIATAAKETAKC
jgi:UPF0176 protein